MATIVHERTVALPHSDRALSALYDWVEGAISMVSRLLARPAKLQRAETLSDRDLADIGVLRTTLTWVGTDRNRDFLLMAGQGVLR